VCQNAVLLHRNARNLGIAPPVDHSKEREKIPSHVESSKKMNMEALDHRGGGGGYSWFFSPEKVPGKKTKGRKKSGPTYLYSKTREREIVRKACAGNRLPVTTGLHSGKKKR